MQPFRVSHSASADWESALADALRGLKPYPEGANLGFLYVTDPMAGHLDEVLAQVRHATGVEHWVGTVGLGVCATGIEYYERPAVAIMLASFSENSFRVFSSLGNGFDDFEREHGAWCASHNPYFGVVHADPRNSSVQELAVGLSERMQGGFLVGGLACATQHFAHVAHEVEQGGLSGVLFDTSVSVSTRLSQGCSPLGERHLVTRGERNLIVELNGRPALEVLKEDVGEVIARDLARAAGYVFVGLPIEGSDTGDYLVRNLVGIDPNQGVIAIGDHISTGDTVMFCRRDARTAVEDLQRMLGELKSSLRAPPRGALYASCIGRGVNLFGPGSEELKMIQAQLGDVPLVGFYANGEICYDRLYAYTGVLTLFT